MPSSWCGILELEFGVQLLMALSLPVMTSGKLFEGAVRTHLASPLRGALFPFFLMSLVLLPLFPLLMIQASGFALMVINGLADILEFRSRQAAAWGIEPVLLMFVDGVEVGAESLLQHVELFGAVPTIPLLLQQRTLGLLHALLAQDHQLLELLLIIHDRISSMSFKVSDMLLVSSLV